MPNILTFSEDMLPRYYPKPTRQSKDISSIVLPPVPTLSGVSLIFDDESEETLKKWKRQHDAKIIDDYNGNQIRTEKKHVRFEGNNHSGDYFNKRRSLPTEKIPPTVSPNLDLSNYESRIPREHYHGQQQPYQPAIYNETVGPQPSVFETQTGGCYLQKKMGVPLTKSANENCVPSPYDRGLHLSNGQNCKMETQCCPVIDHQLINSLKGIGIRNDSVDAQQNKEPFDHTLLGIMEEQSKHILSQQNQILMAKKQNLIQQDQIFMLQHQVQQLLLRAGNIENKTPNKHTQSPIYSELAARPGVITNALKTQNVSTKPMCNSTRSSVGAMPSFVGNLNDSLLQDIQKFAKKSEKDKLIEDLSSQAYLFKGNRLDDTTQSSSAMIDFRTTWGSANVYPNRKSDINITTRKLIYNTSSSSDNVCADEPKCTDRSFALHMLGMKYNCSQDNVTSNMDQRHANHSSSNASNNNQISVNISTETYDYLKRHGLLKE